MVAASWSYNISGAVLVVHDDDVSVDIERLQRFAANFSEKWTVLRLDCDGPEEETSWYRQTRSCVRSKAILWRRHSLSRWSESYEHFSDVDCRVSKKPFKTFCVNLGLTQQNPALQDEEPQAIAVQDSWVLHPHGWTTDEMQTESMKTPIANPNSENRIDRIYYHGLEKNTLRRQNMELWLKDQPITYKRIAATVGEPGVCVKPKNTPNRCKGMDGIAKTLTGMIDNENMTGVSLVLEDDVVPLDQDLRRLEASMKYVPDDWDIIRFDCWGTQDYGLDYVNQFIIDTHIVRKIKTCKHHGLCRQNFCGGAFAMLWRGSSVQKLKTMWNKKPVDDADCVIGKTPSVQSYCVNIGIWDHLYIEREFSDVSMLTS
jgi:hypothetical protein